MLLSYSDFVQARCNVFLQATTLDLATFAPSVTPTSLAPTSSPTFAPIANQTFNMTSGNSTNSTLATVGTDASTDPPSVFSIYQVEQAAAVDECGCLGNITQADSMMFFSCRLNVTDALTLAQRWAFCVYGPSTDNPSPSPTAIPTPPPSPPTDPADPTAAPTTSPGLVDPPSLNSDPAEGNQLSGENTYRILLAPYSDPALNTSSCASFSIARPAGYKVRVEYKCRSVSLSGNGTSTATTATTTAASDQDCQRFLLAAALNEDGNQAADDKQSNAIICGTNAVPFVPVAPTFTTLLSTNLLPSESFPEGTDVTGFADLLAFACSQKQDIANAKGEQETVQRSRFFLRSSAASEGLDVGLEVTVKVRWFGTCPLKTFEVDTVPPTPNTALAVSEAVATAVAASTEGMIVLEVYLLIIFFLHSLISFHLQDYYFWAIVSTMCAGAVTLMVLLGFCCSQRKELKKLRSRQKDMYVQIGNEGRKAMENSWHQRNPSPTSSSKQQRGSGGPKGSNTKKGGSSPVDEENSKRENKSAKKKESKKKKSKKSSKSKYEVVSPSKSPSKALWKQRAQHFMEQLEEAGRKKEQWKKKSEALMVRFKEKVRIHPA